jgi:hypothetical protein
MPDIENTQEMHIFRVEDPNCGKTFTLPVTEGEYKNWKDGMLIQDAMPSLTQDDRELLISGTCPECSQAMMAEPEPDTGHMYNPHCENECCNH